MKKNKLAIYAIHPVMYQVPIFSELAKYLNENEINLESEVLFGDDLSLKEVFFKETNVVFRPDTPFLLDGYNYKFLKNYAKDARSGFFSRVNPGILIELYKNKYDAILIHGYENLTPWLALIGAKLTNTKVIWRGESVLRGVESNNSIKQTIKRFVLKLLFKSCDAVLYSCTGNRKYLKFYEVEDSKLFPILCAVNNDFFQNEKQKYNKSEIKKELDILENDLVLLFSARFTTRKRPYDLLDALSKIDNSNISVLFVGDGIERKKMEQYARDKNIKAIFVGFKNQSEISKYYSVADIDIVISDYDPSPKAMNEAMNFELPIIVTDVVGTADDLVIDGENGFIIKVGDIETLAEKLDYVNNNRDEIQKFGKKSLEIVNQWNYTEDAKGILQAFEYVKVR